MNPPQCGEVAESMRQRVMDLRRAATVLAWLLLALIAYWTLSPIGMRPHIGTWAHVERFGAYALLGFLFATAFPRRIPLVLAMVFGVAVSFELLQMLSADRHARVEDLAVKMSGAACGVGASWFAARHWRRLRGWQSNQNSNHRR
ncbi:VanZ family protein [Sinorhizobium fredii]|uniref:VanZ family protein n=1 Tax=Rhizobium fredii TaxID=380 RepID=UPI0004BAEF77